MPGERRWTAPAWLAAVAVASIALAAAMALVAAFGLGAGLTASPLPSPAAQLRTTGAYACVRHPIYSALVIGGAGVVVLSGRTGRLGVWLGLWVLLLVKTIVEERELTRRFPDYPSYAARTPRLMPNPRRCLPRARAGGEAEPRLRR